MGVNSKVISGPQMMTSSLSQSAKIQLQKVGKQWLKTSWGQQWSRFENSITIFKNHVKKQAKN